MLQADLLKRLIGSTEAAGACGLHRYHLSDWRRQACNMRMRLRYLIDYLGMRMGTGLSR